MDRLCVKINIGGNDRMYSITRSNVAKSISIRDYDNIFEFGVYIPRQFCDRLFCYSDEKLRQFFTRWLPDIIDFVYLIQDVDGERYNALYYLNYKKYKNDERIVRFFEEILSLPLCKTKSARSTIDKND